MGIHRGPNIVKDSLVFGYDTGYGVADNDTATRLYPGRNTVNYLSDGLSGYNVVQGSRWNGATPTYTLGNSEFNTPIGTYNTSGTSYMYSHDYVLDDDLSTLSAQTVTFSVYLKRQGASATVGIRIYDSVSGYTTVYAAATNTFQRFTMSKTLGTNPTRIFVMIDSTNGGIIDFHSPQLEIGAASPFVDGTRSSTQSLIDLKRTTDIDLSNTSFDSTGQPTFDGTDDYIDATVNSITDETSLTISYWFKMNWTSGWSPFITLMDSNGTQKFHTWFGNDRGIDFQTSINSVKPMFVASSTNYPNNEYINVVMVINGRGTNNVKCYVNAVYKAQGSLSFNTHDIDKLRIGRDPGNAYGGGHMPRLAIYNVPLTEPEISQNFNAYKNRFNL